MSSSSALPTSQVCGKEKPKAAFIGRPYEADGCRSGETVSITMTNLIEISRFEHRDPATTGIAPSLDQTNEQDRIAMLEREYKFFVTTDEPHQPEGTDRGLIRRLVMRNFFETKSAGPQNNASEHNSASTVMAKKQLKSRFRLSKVGQEKPDVKSKRKDSKEEPGRAKRKRPKASRTPSGGTNGSEPTGGRTSMVNSPDELLKDDENLNKEGSKGKRRDSRILLKIDPGAHRIDPFDVLPVPGTPQLDMLLKLYKSGSKKNSIAVNAKNTWWSFVSNDAGLLHATLATWALYGMLVRGLSELRFDKLRHKNEAIKEINIKIGSPGGVITDELVGTVLTMANFENLLGAYNAAQLHVAALKRMVNARGGLFAFGHNDGLIRGIIWVDFHTAAAFHNSPSFPQIRLDPDTPPLPDKLLEEAACTSPTTLLQLSVSGIDLFNIFYRLHRLALAASSHWINKINRLTLSNLLYESEYIILSVPDASRDFLDLDLDAENQRDEDYLVREGAAHAASVVEALLAAAQIFIYAALRDIPTNAKIFSILLERLRVAVARPSVCTIHVWKKERNFNMLLWTFIVACSVAPVGGGRAWWIGQLVDIMIELDIKSRFDLEMALQSVAWVDTYFNSVLGGIWEEVAQQRSAGVMGHRDAMVDQPLARPVDAELLTARIWETQVDGAQEEAGLPGEVAYGESRWRADRWYV